MDADSVTLLQGVDLRIVQARGGYRFSLDPILLSHFVAKSAPVKVVDLGTGSGVIPLLLARLTEAERIVGLEIQPAQVVRARKSIELNGLQARIEIMQGDLRQIRQLMPVGQIDLVMANPPYRQCGSGRISPSDERAVSRHELAGGLEDFVAAASWLLANKGRFAVIYLVERLPELLSCMLRQKIEPKRLRMVHPRRGRAAKMVLVEGCKNGRPGLAVESPLYVYEEAVDSRNYTAEVLKMYGECGACG